MFHPHPILISIFVPRHGEAIGGDIEMLGVRPSQSLLARLLPISCTDLHNIWPSDAYRHSLGWVRRWITLTYLWPTFLGHNAKSC